MYVKYSQTVDKFHHFLMDLFFPRFCLGCRKEGEFLCQDCRSILDINRYNYCLCQKPLRLPPGASGRCSSCKHSLLAGLYSALPYQEKALTRNMIYQFKFQPYIKALAPALASLIIEHLVLAQNNTDTIWQNALLLPIPLEKSTHRNRGYNQSEELAKELAKIINIPVIAHNLVKTRKTQPQKDLTAKERQENVRGAFLLKNANELKGKKVFLVDDVYTTGSTMQECAHVLRKSGIKEVWGITLAREG